MFANESERTMKILNVGNPDAFKNFAVCNYFVNKGEEIHYFSPIPPRVKHKGIIYHYDSTGKRTKFGFARNVIFLRRLIRALKPDLVHAHNVYGYGWMAALCGQSPLIIHAYGGDVLPEQMKGIKTYQFWLSRFAIKKADRLVVTGHHMARTVSEKFNVQLEKIETISRGVDLEIFRPLPDDEKKSLRAKYGISPDKFVILSPRYLFDSVYNIDIILRAIAEVQEQSKEILLIQMHNHDVTENCFRQTTQLIAELGIKDKVLLLRNVPNAQMAELYNTSDLCISVPSSDGFPVTVLEASACNVPLIVSRLPYTSEWFENGQNGLVVGSGDVSSLISAIIALKENPGKRAKFAENNFRKVSIEADYKCCMQKLATLYEEVLRA